MKCHKQNQNDFRAVIFTSRDDVPSAYDPARLLAIQAVKDQAIEGITSPRQLDGAHLTVADIPAATNCLDLPPIKEDKLDLPVMRIIERRGAGQRWRVHDSKPMTLKSMYLAFNKVRPLSWPQLTFSDFLRGATALLDRPTITEQQVSAGMGHCESSTVMARHYLPRRAVYDLMGIAVNDEEDRSTCQWLGQDANPIIPLTSAEQVQLRLKPAIVAARKAKDDALEKLRATESYKDQGKGDERSAEHEHLSQTLQRFSTLVATRRQELELEKGKEAAKETLNKAWAKDGIAAPEQQQQQQQQENEQDDALTAAEVLMHLSERTSASSTSDSSSPSPIAPSSSPAQRFGQILADGPGNNPNAAVLAQAHQDLRVKYGSSALDLSRLLATGDDKPLFSEAFELFTSDFGVDHDARVDACPVCKEDLTEAQSVTAKRVHVQSCRGREILRELEELTEAQSKRVGCPLFGCSATTKAKAARKSIETHMNTKHEGLERECRCKVTIDGQETCCSFSVPSETPLDQAVLAAHRQEAHGLVIAPKDSYLWGADDEIFLVGIAEIQARCTARLPAAGDTLRTTEYPFTNKHCALCLFDEDRDPLSRYTQRDSGSQLSHLAKNHFNVALGQSAEQAARLRCPCCGEKLWVWEVVEHLEERGVSILKRRSPSESADTLDRMRPPGEVRAKAKFDAWQVEMKKVKSSRTVQTANDSSETPP